MIVLLKRNSVKMLFFLGAFLRVLSKDRQSESLSIQMDISVGHYFKSPYCMTVKCVPPGPTYRRTIKPSPS